MDSNASNKANQQNIPEDLAKSADIQNDVDSEDNINLFNYFVSANKENIIKKWGYLYQKDNTRAFCELIMLIFQLAGHKVDISAAHYESVAGESLIDEYTDASESDPSFKPPVNSFTKNETKLLSEFWVSISKQIISTQAIFTQQAVSFKNWIVLLSDAHPRLIRYVTITAASCFFIALTESINTKTEELNRLTGKNKNSDIIKAKIESLTNENRFLLSSANNIYNNILVKSLRDNDPSIRIIALDSIVDGAIQCPTPFADESHITQLTIAIRDKVVKDRQNALKCILKLMDNLKPEQWGELAIRIESNLLDLCDDKDNKTVETVLLILKKMSENGKIRASAEQLDSASYLLADATPSVRIAAQKFVMTYFFDSSKSNEEQLDHFLEFSKRFAREELSAVIGVLYHALGCLKAWDSMCQKMRTIEDDGARRLSWTMFFSAQAASGKLQNTPMEQDPEILANLSLSLVSNLPQLIPSFPNDPETQIYLIQCASMIDLDAVSEFSVDRLFPELLSSIREVFLQTSDKKLFECASSVLYELSLGHHQLNQIARTELDKLAVGCAEISSASKDIAVSKFLAAARFVNMSDSTKIREFLLKSVDDQNLSATSIEALDLFFQWDVLRLKDHKNEIPEYEEMFKKLVSIFEDKMIKGNLEAKIAAIRAVSDVFCLQNIINSDYSKITEEFVKEYCNEWHSLKFKKDQNLFQHLIRPFLWGVLSHRYLAHFFCYCLDENLRDIVSQCAAEIKKSGQINGGEVFPALVAMKNNGCPDQMIIGAARYFVRKFNKIDVIKSFIASDDDSLDENAIIFIRALTKEEASAILPSAGRFSEAVEKIIKDQKPQLIKKKIKKETKEKSEELVVVGE